MIRLPTSTGLDSVESPFVVFSRPWIFLSLQTLKKPSNARSWAGAKALALRAQQGSLDTRFFDEVFPETNITHMDVSKNRGKKPNFWMVYNGKPYFLMDDLGRKPTIFGNIPICSMKPWHPFLGNLVILESKTLQGKTNVRENHLTFQFLVYQNLIEMSPWQ